MVRGKAEEIAMAGRYKSPLKWSDVTPERAYLSRREIIAGAGAAGLMGLAGPAAASRFSTQEKPNSWEEITSYNNFYEFGTGKDDPARNAHRLTTAPWTVKIDGMVDRPGSYAFEDILKKMTIEERLYRFRCVEAWSMVIPWTGIPLADVIRRLEPTGKARFVEFTTLLDPEQMPGQRRRVLDWPYVEGLRLDEAMHPLTLLTFGLYGEVLPNQNGAPLRIVVPWKYGFKSAKSLVHIRLVEKQPVNSWQKSAPGEYGFYSNVNPNVDHPRWSQATERRLGSSLFSPRAPTLMFNGYADQVADLYRGLDLVKNY